MVTGLVNDPVLEITKVANPGGIAQVGDTISYLIVVNHAADSVGSAFNVAVTDPLLSDFSCVEYDANGVEFIDPANDWATNGYLTNGHELVCVGYYTVQGSDVPGSVMNTATVSYEDPDGDPKEDVTDDEHVPTEEVPEEGNIQISKSVAGDPSGGVDASIFDAGDTVTYNLVVTNTSGVPVYDWAVTDPLAASNPVCDAGTTATNPLLPGASVACSFTYVLTAADELAHVRDNTATVEGLADTDGDNIGDTPVSDIDSATIATSATNVAPAIDVTKNLVGNDDPDGSFSATIGDTLSYQITATNTGNVALVNVEIADSIIAAGDLACTLGGAPFANNGTESLAVGATVECIGTYVVTTADVLDGDNLVINTAVGTGQPDADNDGQPDDLDGDGQPDQVSDNETVVTGLVSDPVLEITKVANPGGLVQPGDTISYSLAVTNTGFGPAFDVEVIDNFYTPLECMTETVIRTPLVGYPSPLDAPLPFVNDGNSDLYPGHTIYCVYVHTVTGVEPNLFDGVIENIAMAIGVDFDGKPGDPTNTDVFAEDDEFVPFEELPTTGGIHLSKRPFVIAGDPSVPLLDNDGNNVPSIGDEFTYEFVVSNTNAIQLQNVVVTDELLNPVAPHVVCDAGNLSGAAVAGTLEPGESATCTVTVTLTGAMFDQSTIDNTATALGDPDIDGDGTITGFEATQTLSDQDSTTIDGDALNPAPAIDLTKSLVGFDDNDGNPADPLTYVAGGEGVISLGDTLRFSLVVTNTSNVAVDNVEVIDPMLADLTCLPGQNVTLAPFEQVVCTGSYTVTEADYFKILDNGNLQGGKITNTAEAIGVGPQGEEITDVERVVVEYEVMPELELIKTANPGDIVQAGDTITYTIVTTNIGNFPAYDVEVSDPLFNSSPVNTFECEPTTQAVDPANNQTFENGLTNLYPGESITCVGIFHVTEEMIEAGDINNVATAKAVLPPSDRMPLELKLRAEDEVVVTTEPLPEIASLEIKKTPVSYQDMQAQGDPGYGRISEGDIVTYELVSLNTSIIPVSNVTLNDDLIATLTCVVYRADGSTDAFVNGSTTLMSGENVTCLGDLELTAANLGITVPADYSFDTFVGNVMNTATTTGLADPDGDGVGDIGAPLSDTDTATVTVDPSVTSPAIDTSKTIIAYNDNDASQTISINDDVIYAIRVTNTGNVDLFNVEVEDSLFDIVGCEYHDGLTAGAVFNNGTDGLAIGESVRCYVIATIDRDLVDELDGAILNVATGTGTSADDETVVDVDALIIGAAAQIPPELTVTKTIAPAEVEIGGISTWTVTMENTGDVPAIMVDLVDVLPAGFTYEEGSAIITLVGTATQNFGDDEPTDIGTSGTYPSPAGLPVILNDGQAVSNSGQVLTWSSFNLPATGDAVIVEFITVAGIGLNEGVYENQAYAVNEALFEGEEALLSNLATAEVEVIGGIFECATVIGQVFEDHNRDGYQDPGEPGIPGVRLGSPEGYLITVDDNGRYHVPCGVIPNADRGTNFILKLDESTLPSGFRMTTENPRVIRLTAGKMSRLDFGASIDRVVRLDVTDCAYQPGELTNLDPQWAAGLDELVRQLSTSQSTIRVAYRRAEGTTQELAQRRISDLIEKVGSRWSTVGTYPLSIEQEIVVVRGQQVLDCEAQPVPASAPLVAQPPEAPQIIQIENIYFDFDKDFVRQREMMRIQRVAAILQANPQFTVLVSGHTDNAGTNAYNEDLSARRTRNAALALAGLGIVPSRILLQQSGERNTVAPPAQANGAQQLNRRVTFTIINGGDVVASSGR